MNLSNTPIFDNLKEQGIIYFDTENKEWVGIASDNVHVHLGNTPEECENYLSHRPSPSQW